MIRILSFICFYSIFSGLVQAQKIHVEWVSGEVKLVQNGNQNIKLRKNDVLKTTDKLFLGEKALLLVSNDKNQLFEVKKKGYVSFKDLKEGLAKTSDNEYQRYLSYVLKELLGHESEMKSSDKGIPGAPSRGEEFVLKLPDSIYYFSQYVLNLFWKKGPNTQSVLVELSNSGEKLFEFESDGDYGKLNLLDAYFNKSEDLRLVVSEKLFDGSVIQKTICIIHKYDHAALGYTSTPGLRIDGIEGDVNQWIAEAKYFEDRKYFLRSLAIYMELLKKYPDNILVESCLSQFSLRTGIR